VKLYKYTHIFLVCYLNLLYIDSISSGKLPRFYSFLFLFSSSLFSFLFLFYSLKWDLTALARVASNLLDLTYPCASDFHIAEATGVHYCTSLFFFNMFIIVILNSWSANTNIWMIFGSVSNVYFALLAIGCIFLLLCKPYKILKCMTESIKDI
jgi:hypothetical protein